MRPRGDSGRFPFDQIFRFEIPGIPCDEWNSNFPVPQINQSQAIGFQVSRESTRSNGGLFHLCLLALGLLNDSEVKINDELGEGDNTTTFTVPLYFPDEFKSHFDLKSHFPAIDERAVHSSGYARISRSSHVF